MQQQVQPDSVKSTSWVDRLVIWAVNKLPLQVGQRLDKLPYGTRLMVLVAVLSLSCVSWDVRLTSKRRKHTPKKKNLGEEKFVPLKYTEQDEPDAEPKGRNLWTSIPGNDLRRTMSDMSGKSPKQSSHPVVPMKALMPKHPVASTDDEPEDEDYTGNHCWAAPGSHGFVAQRTAEVECVLQIFRMNTEGQFQLVDEEGLEQKNRERQFVPNGLVRSCTLGLERKIQEENPLRSKSKSLP